MPNFIDLNSAKPAPPKRRKSPSVAMNPLVLNNGYRCASCKAEFASTAGSKFKMIGRYRRRVCMGCA